MKARKLAVVAAAMTALTAAAVPAYAQEETTTASTAQQQGSGSAQYAGDAVGQPGPRTVTAIGVLGEPRTPGPDPTPVYDLTDEATGTTYALFDVGAGLAPYVGQRVTVEGTRSPGIDPLALDATSVSAAGDAGQGQQQPTRVTWTFELATECEPPAGSAFFGRTIAPEGTMAGAMDVALSDPDGDGVYAGSDSGYVVAGSTAPNIDTAPPRIQVVRGAAVVGPSGDAYPDPARPVGVIEDFGVVKLDEDKTFSASVSFCEEGGTEQPTMNPAQPTDECEALSPTPEECEGYVAPVAPGGSGNGGGTAVVSGGVSNGKGDVSVVPAPVADVDGDGSVDAFDGEKAAEISGSAAEGSASSAAKVLPATGGVLPIAGAAGALLIGGGLLARRIFR